ncbi:MAG: hypothetical protein ABIP53_05500 [Candidatus Limnocylindrales bacterium]
MNLLRPATLIATLALSACSGVTAPTSAPPSPVVSTASPTTAPPTDSPSPSAALPTASPTPTVAPTLTAGSPGRILLLRFPESGPAAYYVVNADGSAEEPFGPRGDYETRQVSPDESLLAVVGPNSQGTFASGTMGLDGIGWHLFENPDPSLNLACGVWAPDERMACEGWSDSDSSLDGIYTALASDGSDPQRLTTGRDAPCDYSPDGSQLAFVRGDKLMVVASGGGEPEVLQEAVGTSGLPCDWSPDGDTILTASTDGKLQVVTREGDSAPFIGDGLRGYISNGAWSSDGSRILLTMALPGEQGDVYTIAADGSDLRQITHSPLLEEAIAWLPASTPPAAPEGRLVYGRFDTFGQTPFTSNIDGTDERKLLSPPAWVGSWAPNGLLLAVAVGEPPQEPLFTGTVKPDGSDFVQFDRPDASLNLGCSTWSPDGSRLACEGWDDTDPTRNGIYTVRSTDCGDLTRITTSPVDRHDSPADYTLDGSQIIFSRSNPEPDELGDDSHLMVVKLDGSDEHRLSEQSMSGGRLSPDGTTILAAAGSYLVLLPVDGGQPTPIRIAQAPNATYFGGAWSPDGQWIVFTLHQRNEGHSDIYIMRRDGTDLRQVTHTPSEDEEFAGWAPAP